MNHELKQRLIGAVVVTALAAIFIPMLFDDPIDNSGQVVSELAIPATPPVVPEPVANKLPTNAKQVLTAAENPDNVAATEDDADQANGTQAQPPEQPNAEDLVDVDEDQVLADNKKNLAESATADDSAGQPVDEPKANSSGSRDDLDTGVVEGAKTQAKKPKSAAVSVSDKDMGLAKPGKTKPTTEKTRSAKAAAVVDLEKTRVSRAALNGDFSEKTPAETKPKSSAIKPAAVTKTSKVGKPAGTAKATATDTAKPSVAVKDSTAASKADLQRWYINAGSFSQRDNALALYENLRKQGLPVTMDTIKVAEKGELYRLKIGPELDKKRAQAIREKLDKQNINTFLIPVE